MLEFNLWLKTVNGCKDVSIMSTQDEQGRLTSLLLCAYWNFLVLLSTNVCSQNINKQNVNIADETFTDDSFLSRYHYTKWNNYLKRRFQIRHWISMFIGTHCSMRLGDDFWLARRTLFESWGSGGQFARLMDALYPLPNQICYAINALSF